MPAACQIASRKQAGESHQSSCLDYPNGVTSNYTYDTCTNLQLCSILHQVSGTTLDGTSYTYDNAGNRLTKTNQRTGLVSNYTYDNLYEATQVVEGSTTTSYTYDAVGNRATLNGASYTVTTSNNQLTGIPQTYLSAAATQTFDNNGNTLTRAPSSGTTTYNWDFENRLTSVVLPGSGGTVSFKYDPFGRRIQKVAPSGTTNFVYDGANVLEDVDGSGNVLARYVQGAGIDEPLAETRSSVTSYYEADGLGSITSLSNSSHALANTYTYDTYGSISASTGSVVNRFTFTGREYDSETGLYYYRARYYDASTGRFMSEDPLRFKAGADFYGYAADNPSGLVDPSGLLYVLVWNSTGSAGSGNWGHAAILLDNGTYISWWPKAWDAGNPDIINEDGGKHRATNARDPNYTDDVTGEGHNPDEWIYINSLDEGAIQKWWDSFQKNRIWDSYKRNCSNAAIEALKAGGAGNFVTPPKNWIAPVSPADVLRYSQRLQLYNNINWDHGVGLRF